MLTMILFLSFIFITACENDSKQEQVNLYIDKIKEKLSHHKDQTNNVAIFKIPEKMLYQREITRSPFANSEFVAANRTGQPLEQYSLSMLHFVGTVTNHNIYYAYILAPDNKLYTVKLGDILGDHQGVITEIDVDRIEIMETINEAGKPVAQRIITLQLKDDLK